MLNPVINSNLRFVQKSLTNTKQFAAVKLAENEITREEYDEVVDYVESMRLRCSEEYADRDIWEED